MKGKGNNNKRILLFVCTGNTCRSPMAEQIFNRFLAKKGLNMLYKACSAGMCANKDDALSNNAAAALISLGIKLKKHHCQRLTRSKAAKAHVIICMSKWHKDKILEEFGLSGNVFCFSEVTGAFDVPDPFGMDVDKYISCANYLNYACEDILRLLNDAEPAKTN